MTDREIDLKIALCVAITAWAIKEFGEKKVDFRAIDRLVDVIKRVFKEAK